jgi:uncharacterized membrane protein YhaH (DUF805 family)
MELLFVTLGGLILGTAARYTLPHRAEIGVAVAPAVGAGVAAAVWVALTWAGLAWDGGWIWVASLVLAGLASVATELTLGRRRVRDDEQLLARLTRG